MKWLKRGLWLAAWGAWIWLGVGLHRELPRENGASVAKLPLSVREQVLSFSGSGNDSVVTVEFMRGVARVFRIWEVPSGRKLREWNAPAPGESLGVMDALRHHIVIVPSREPGGGPVLRAMHVVTGAACTIGPSSLQLHDVNGKKPWGVFLDQSDRGPSAFVVCDLLTGEKLCDGGMLKAEPGPLQTVVELRFMPGGTELLIGFTVKEEEFRRGRLRALETWDVVERRRRSRVELPEHLSEMHGPATNGRVLLESSGPIRRIMVIDPTTGAACFDTNSAATRAAAAHEEEMFALGGPVPLLGRSGLTIMFPTVLWSLDDGKALRRSPPHHEVFYSPPEEFEGVASRFGVREDWRRRFEDWPLAERLSAITTIREMDTGAIVERQWGAESQIACESDDRRWTVSMAGDILSPRRPNYALLVLCQAVVALPLILLWAFLRRRLRMAMVQP